MASRIRDAVKLALPQSGKKPNSVKAYQYGATPGLAALSEVD